MGLKLKETRTKVLLRSMVADGKVEAIGGNRDRKYRLPEKIQWIFYIFEICMNFFWSYIDSFGGTGVWDRVQDLHNCRTGDFIWDFYQLGAGVDLLDRGDDGDFSDVTKIGW